MLFRCSKPTGKTTCAGHSSFTVNTAVGRKLARGRKRVPNVLRMDPTRTAALRRQIETEIKVRFKRLKGKVLKLVVDEDAFGLKPRNDGFTGNAFCPTGEGGGVDPSCSPVDSGGSRAEVAVRTTAPQAVEKFLASTHEGRFDDPRYSEIGAAVTDEHKKLLAVKDGSLVGALSYKLSKTGKHELIQVGSIEKGVGTVLVKQLQAKGKPIIARTVRSQARGFYEKMGFKQFAGDDMLWQPSSTRNITANVGRWEFLSDPDKIKAFREWLRSQIKVDILSDEDLWRRYAEMGWKKGAARAFDDVKSPAKSLLSIGDEGFQAFQGTKDEFLRSAFNKPVPANRIKLLASRSYHDLEGITEQMSTVMTRTLTDGLSQGANPREIARDLVDEVDGLGMARATTMARTEIIRAHAEGQLDSMTELGVTEVGVQVEWNTAGDEAVCPQCEPLEGVVLNIDEARGMLPRHPNCRCAWIPANVGEDDSEQKDTKKQIESAVRASVKAGSEKDIEEGGWGPATDISKIRPTRNEDAILALDEVLLNVFCPTGEGGGVDPTCSLTGGGGGGGAGGHDGGGVEDFKFYQSPHRITGESFSTPSVDKAGASEISLRLKENPDYLKENPPFQYVKVKKLSIPEKDKEMLDRSAVIKHVDMEELFTSQKFLKPKTVREYMSRIRNKDVEGELPTVFEHEGKLIIEDGNHKLAAAKLLGIKRVQVKVWDVSKLAGSTS